MLSKKILSEVAGAQTTALAAELPPLLWQTLSPTEKLQLIDEVPKRAVVELALQDESAMVRYWAIRHAGYQRGGHIRWEHLAQLRHDPCPLVAHRASVWSYDDLESSELSAVDSFLYGARWTELRRLHAIVERLLSVEEPDWPRLQVILHAYFLSPGVERELRDPTQHHVLLVGDAVKALEFIKALAIKHDDRLGSRLALLLPVRFHGFDLTDGWEWFPFNMLTTLAASRADEYVVKRVREQIAKLSGSRPDYAKLCDEIKSLDASWEFEWSQ